MKKSIVGGFFAGHEFRLPNNQVLLTFAPMAWNENKKKTPLLLTFHPFPAPMEERELTRKEAAELIKSTR
jgi:hypothetical protein